jgi:cell envelope opacity-associated protein A
VNSYVKGEKTELTGKDVLKGEKFKAGAKVTVLTDADGKVTEIRFGKPMKKKKESK